MNTALNLVTFLAKKLIAIAMIILLIVLATFMSYDMANIYVVINDGLSQRADIVIHREKPAELERFFTLRFLNSDPMLQSEQFVDYIVNDYDYELNIKKLWVWPWESTTEITVEEMIPESSWKFNITEEMRTRLTAAQMPQVEQTEEDEEGDESSEETLQEEEFILEIPNPYWQNGEKVIEFRKVDGQWKINGIVFVKSISPEQNDVD